MSDTAYEDAQWRRLDARMLLVHPVQEAVRFLPALVIFFFTGRSSGRSGWWDWGALAVVVALGMSRWFTTRYRIWNGQIELRRGLVLRRVLATPADRVRTVDVTAPPWHRVLGLAKVELGTAGQQHGDRIVLDALASAEAARLRAELLHRIAAHPGASRSDPAAAESDPPAVESDSPAAEPEPHAPDEQVSEETVLVSLDPRWVRYAPLTTSGLVSALAIWGFAMQLLGDQVDGVLSAVAWVQGVGLLLNLGVGLLGASVAIAALAVTAYVLSFWGFRLTRHRGGTLHTTRGLLTSRATSLEEARVRGVEIGEPLGLRLARAARLQAITTGLRRHEQREGSALLTPPAPSAVVSQVADEVVGDREAICGVLVAHGPAARRRRWTRAVGTAFVIAFGVLLARWRWGLPLGLVGLGFLPLVASPWLAADRYAALGHLLTGRHIVVRSGSLTRRRDVVQRDGVIGVVLRESFFQRRAGVATLTVTTAAGKQGYHAIDLPAGRAVDLATQLLPGPVGQFRGK